jgi:DNA-directed RNA polymerase subunit RPC12/RpoP
MPRLRCPECRSLFEVDSLDGVECTRCGHRAPVKESSNPARLAKPEGWRERASKRPLGRRRSFALGFAYGVLSLGIYWVYWGFVVMLEVDRHRGRRHDSVLYVMGLLPVVGWPLYIAYWIRELGALRKAALTMDVRPPPSTGRLLTFSLLAPLTLGLTLIPLAAGITRSVNAYWERWTPPSSVAAEAASAASA